MSYYTPTTDELRDIWVDYNLNPLPRSQGIPLVETAQADFDRWLETVRAEAKAEAWDECMSSAYIDGVNRRVVNTPNPYKENQS